MKTRQALNVALFCSGLIWASCGSERALWIEVSENGGDKTTIAVTEGIVRRFLESTTGEVGLAKTGGDELITREMLYSVLDGRKSSLTSRDGQGSEAIIYAKPLPTPEHSGSDRLVLETYKAGRQVFRIALPQFDIEQADKKSDEFVKVSLGWKTLLPFLAETGGAVYIKDEQSEREMWIYVE